MVMLNWVFWSPAVLWIDIFGGLQRFWWCWWCSSDWVFLDKYQTKNDRFQQMIVIWLKSIRGGFRLASKLGRHECQVTSTAFSRTKQYPVRTKRLQFSSGYNIQLISKLDQFGNTFPIAISIRPRIFSYLFYSCVLLFPKYRYSKTKLDAQSLVGARELRNACRHRHITIRILRANTLLSFIWKTFAIFFFLSTCSALDASFIFKTLARLASRSFLSPNEKIEAKNVL